MSSSTPAPRFSTGSETPPSFSDDGKQPFSHSDLPNHLTPQEQLALAEEYARRRLTSDSVNQNASLMPPQGTSGRSSSGADEAPYNPLQSPAPVPAPVFAYPGNAPFPPQDAGAVAPVRAVDIEANAAVPSGGGARAAAGGGGGGRGAGRRGTNGAGTADPNAAAALLAEKLGEQGLRLRFARLEFGPTGEVMAPVLQTFTPIEWGAWAYYMALGTACLAFFFGPMSIIWWHYGTSPLYKHSFNLGAGIYSILVGLVIVWEEWLGLPLLGWVAAYLDVTVSRYNLRSILYIVLSSLLFLSYPTVVVGVCLIITALADRTACAHGETFWQNLTPPARAPRKVDPNAKAPPTRLQLFKQRMARWLEILLHLRDANRIGIVVWMSILLAGNILMFVYVLHVWINRVGASRQAAEAAGTDTALSYWIAPAKAFGLCLDLDLALILLPVCRTLIRWLYEYSTRDESYSTLALRGLLYLVPLDFHIHFHKLMGVFIIVCGVGHTLAHFVNFAQKPDVTLAVLGGPWALISGGLIIVLMFVMYSSTFEFVRRRSFDLFFSSHHLFVFLYVLLLVHGAHGEGPNFWKYFIGPATLYLLDRALRLYQGSKPVTVHSVQFMRDVMCIAFNPSGPFGSGVQCGQYILIQCPAVSSLQWHPFTISSAPGDPFVTVHIKMNTEKPSSWTYRVAAHLSLMRDFKPRLHSEMSQEQKEAWLKEEPNWEYIPMKHVEGSETKPGRVMGIDDRPMFRIDGPHAAPTQNLPKYDVALVVGAGIGSTPLAASLHYVVDQWALPLMETPVQPSCVSFVWVLKYENILSFRWLVGRIRETRMRVQTLRQQGRMSGRAWEMHIYVTSFPESRMQVEEDLARLDEEQIRQRHREPQRRMMNPDEPALDPEDFALLRLLTDPPNKSTEEAARWNRDPIQKEDIFVHSGRAEWPDMFAALGNRHPDTDIGVMFCGLPDIAKPVRSACWKSNARPDARGTHFTFHGENF